MYPTLYLATLLCLTGCSETHLLKAAEKGILNPLCLKKWHCPLHPSSRSIILGFVPSSSEPCIQLHNLPASEIPPKSPPSFRCLAPHRPALPTMSGLNFCKDSLWQLLPSLATRGPSPHCVDAVPGRIHLYIPVCDVADSQRAQKEAQVHTGLKEIHLPRVITHQVKLWVGGAKTHKTVCKLNYAYRFPCRKCQRTTQKCGIPGPLTSFPFTTFS